MILCPLFRQLAIFLERPQGHYALHARREGVPQLKRDNAQAEQVHLQGVYLHAYPVSDSPSDIPSGFIPLAEAASATVSKQSVSHLQPSRGMVAEGQLLCSPSRKCGAARPIVCCD